MRAARSAPFIAVAVAVIVIVLLPLTLDGYHEGLVARVANYFMAILGLNI